MSILTKMCKICQVEKPVTEFGKASNIKSGYRARCKLCVDKDRRSKNFPRVKHGSFKCVTCLEEKDVSDFGNNKRRENGIHYDCKLCSREKSKARRAKDDGNYVYILQEGDRIKIGVTNNLKTRVNSIMSVSGLQIVLLGCFKFPKGEDGKYLSHKLESELHEYYREFRIYLKGHFNSKKIETEWFLLKDKQINEIISMKGFRAIF